MINNATPPIPDHLWEILLKQAEIQAYFDLGALVLFVIVAQTFGKMAKTAFRKTDDSPLFITYSLISFSFAMLSIVCFYSAAFWFLNPEYWALKQVLGVDK